MNVDVADACTVCGREPGDRSSSCCPEHVFLREISKRGSLFIQLEGPLSDLLQNNPLHHEIKD